MPSTRDRDSGSPPRLTVRAEAGMPPVRTSSAMAEGTVSIRVTSSRAGSDGSSRALAARISVPPRASVTKISKTDMSKLIDVEPSTPVISASENTSRDQGTSREAVRCSMATPLGRPVEPEV
jgi:hypothetical protein